MALYMSFPVGAFLIFNSPSFYENAIFEWRKELDALIVKEKTKTLKNILKNVKESE